MIKRWSRRTKQIVSSIAVTCLVCVLISLVLGSIVQKRWQEERMVLQTELENARASLGTANEHLNQHQASVWQFSRALTSGETISSADIELVQIDEKAAPLETVKDKEQIVGQVLKIDVSQRTAVLSSMLAGTEPLLDDVRWLETSVIQLPLKLVQDEYVDVRIRFANGLDYVVLSQKKVIDIEIPTLWTHMSEQELLMLSSAYVDAYLNNAQLYAVRYIDGMVQEEAIVNYPVNADVLRLIENDPNIIERAKTAMSEQARRLLEQKLDSTQQKGGANSSNVTRGSSFSSSSSQSSSTSSYASDPLTYSPFTGLAPPSVRHSPFVGEGSGSTSPRQTELDTEHSQVPNSEPEN